MRKMWEKVSQINATCCPKARRSARSWICKKRTGNGGLSTFYRFEAAKWDAFWKQIWGKCRFGCQVGQKTAFGWHFGGHEAAIGSEKGAKLAPNGSQDERKWQPKGMQVASQNSMQKRSSLGGLRGQVKSTWGSPPPLFRYLNTGIPVTTHSNSKVD